MQYAIFHLKIQKKKKKKGEILINNSKYLSKVYQKVH